MTLHTANGCSVATPMNGTGTVQGTNCYAYANNNAGCGISDSTSTSYGSGLNANGGGVWATLWNAAGINLWFFPRASIPSDIAAGAPVPFSTAWGKPKVRCSLCTPLNTLGIFRQLHLFDVEVFRTADHRL